MNTKKIVSELKKKYPGKEIILNPSKNPTEIIVEIDPTSDHPEYGVALAVVGRSEPHYHKNTTEVYQVIKGKLIVYIAGKKHILKEKEKITINPGTIHYVVGNETQFLTYAKPGWTAQDHILE